MRPLGAVLWLLALAAAFWLGGQRPAAGVPEPTSISSFEAAVREPNRTRRSFEVSRFLRGFDPQQIDEVIEIVEAQRIRFDQQDYRLLMAAWVPIDSLTPVDWSFSQLGSLKRRATAAVVEELGFRIPEAARSIVTSLDSEDLLEVLHFYMVRGWARSGEIAELTGYLDSLPRGEDRLHALGAAAGEISRRGPEELMAWVDAIPDDASASFEASAFQKSVEALARVEPRRAAEWVDDNLDRPSADLAVRSVAEPWAEREPAAAMDWLLTLPDENDPVEVVESTFSAWLEIDSQLAESWVRSAEPGASRDWAIRMLVRRHHAEHPADAMDWAHLISDPAIRLRALTRAGRTWNRRDPDAFEAWLPESGLENQIRDLISYLAERDIESQSVEEANVAEDAEEESARPW